MLWLIVVILVIFWLGGFALNVGGGLIHFLLLLALMVFLWNVTVGRRPS